MSASAAASTRQSRWRRSRPFFRENSERNKERFADPEIRLLFLLQTFLQRALDGGGRSERESGPDWVRVVVSGAPQSLENHGLSVSTNELRALAASAASQGRAERPWGAILSDCSSGRPLEARTRSAGTGMVRLRTT